MLMDFVSCAKMPGPFKFIAVKGLVYSFPTQQKHLVSCSLIGLTLHNKYSCTICTKLPGTYCYTLPTHVQYTSCVQGNTMATERLCCPIATVWVLVRCQLDVLLTQPILPHRMNMLCATYNPHFVLCTVESL